MEIFLIGAIIVFVLIYNGTVDTKKFAKDNEKIIVNIKNMAEIPNIPVLT